MIISIKGERRSQTHILHWDAQQPLNQAKTNIDSLFGFFHLFLFFFTPRFLLPQLLIAIPPYPSFFWMLAYKISGNFNKCRKNRKNGVLLFGCFGNVESRPRKEKENNGACALYSLVEQHKMQSSNKESELNKTKEWIIKTRKTRTISNKNLSKGDQLPL